MSSGSGVLLGRQEPRVRLEPGAKRSDGEDACFLSASYGLTPDPWQALVIASWLGRKADGKLASGRCGLAVPRQNGKNGVLEVVELFKLVVEGRRILHTAHEVKTARKAFVRLCGFFENARQWPELAALVKEIRRTNGQEAIVLSNGGSVEFVARSRGSGRGYTVDDLVCDEAQELTDEQLEALLPTISSAPSGDPQVIMTGTPPGPGSPGEVFTRMRLAGVKGKDRRLSWHEWSVDGEVDVNDRAHWYSTNPSLGKRLNIEVLVDEVAGMTVDGFARERLGRWADERGGGPGLNPVTWARGLDPDSQITGHLAFGVAMSADKSTVTVMALGRRSDRHYHGELVAEQRGTTWVAPWLAERVSGHGAVATVIDPASGAASLIPELERAGVVVDLVTVGELAQACGRLNDLVTEGQFHHLGQAPLNAAVAGSRAHELTRGGWLWRARGSESIAPLNALTLALAGFESKLSGDPAMNVW